MKNQFLLLPLFLLVSFSLFAQKNYWHPTSIHSKKMIPTQRMPAIYKSYKIDLSPLKKQLLSAPDMMSHKTSDILVNIPDEKGVFHTFFIYKSLTLPKELKSETHIQTYRGYDEKGNIASIVSSPLGLHIGILRTGRSDLVIEPVTADLQYEIVFSKDQLPPIHFECLTQSLAPDPKITSSQHSKISDEILRAYRFAIGTTGEYAQYHINRAINNGTLDQNASDAQKKDVVLAAVAVTVDRVNSVYERDFGVTLELVPNERNVIFLDPNNDPYNNDDLSAMLHNNTNVLNNNIGASNYDGGHLFTTYAGGGVSYLGIICGNNKGASVTGSTNPVGDAYDIDYVAHEIGHAFGCNHTFANSCSDNRNLPTAMEPGSGTTIMAYAGVCSPNVQIHSNDYFHVMSIAEAGNFVRTTATCSANNNIGNHKPVITPVDYGNVYIPKSTPFMLQTEATDPDAGDALTYCWEQIDAVTDSNITSWVPHSDYTNGPLFRSYAPSFNKVRYFPTMTNILNNTYENTWEVLPAVNRSLHFGITVRDNHTGGGQSPNAGVQFNVDENSGPFRITNLSQNETWQAGESHTITWDVAGTDSGLVNCTTVDILFSADDGVNFPYLVASDIPNNGVAQFTVPNFENTTLGRFMIKAHHNYFFDVAKGRFTIQGVNNLTSNNLKALKIYPNPVRQHVHVSFETSNTLDAVKIRLLDLSGREIYKQIYQPVKKFDQIINLESYARGLYLIQINQGDSFDTHKLILK